MENSRGKNPAAAVRRTLFPVLRDSLDEVDAVGCILAVTEWAILLSKHKEWKLPRETPLHHTENEG